VLMEEKEKIGWEDHVKNEEVLLIVTEEKNILRTVKRRKAKGQFTHSMPFPCRVHVVPHPCRAAKSLECVFPI